MRLPWITDPHLNFLKGEGPKDFGQRVREEIPDLNAVLLTGDIGEHQNFVKLTEKFAEGVKLITPLALSLPQAHFELAWKLARDYRDAALAAGMEPDPECTWPLEVMERLKQQPEEDERQE